MSDRNASLEVIAPSVEEAVEKGLNELGLPRDAVEVDVLDPGSRGLFGIGSRHARVRLRVKGVAAEAPTKSQIAIPEMEESPPAAVEVESVKLEEEILEVEKPPAEQGPGADAEDEQSEYVLEIARETVGELLDKMRVRVDQVTAHYGEADEDRSRVPVLVDIHGRDLSILIGPKAETLNALQFVAALIVGKELGRSIPLVVDVEGYRQRRERQLRQLARRMAEQAVTTGRRQILEPMPANERRIIHVELRKNPYVTTESIGEDPRRKVTILPSMQ